MTHWLWAALKSLTVNKPPPIEKTPEPQPLPLEEVDVFGIRCVGVRDSSGNCYWAGSFLDTQVLVFFDDIEMRWRIDVDCDTDHGIVAVVGCGDSICAAERDVKAKIKALIVIAQGFV